MFDEQRMQEIGRRLAQERMDAETRRREADEYWAYQRTKRQEANSPYILPVLIVMVLAFCIASFAMSWAFKLRLGQAREILMAIGTICGLVGIACIVGEMFLIDIQL